MIKFEVMGKPVGKGRPRFSGVGGRVRTYTPSETTAYENEVAMAYRLAEALTDTNKIPRFDMAVCVGITAIYAVPKAFSRAKKEQALRGEIRPQTKPDIDNVVKIVLDGLNKIAYADDSQVAEICAVKQYGENAKVRVVLEEC